MKTLLLTLKTSLVALSIAGMLIPAFVEAQTPEKCIPSKNGTETEYCLLSPIPLDGASGGATDKTSTSKFLPGLFRLTIGLAGVLAVVMIMWGGFIYITKDTFGAKEDAKDMITNAMIGLILTIASYLIINTINPKLVEFELSIMSLPPGQNVNFPNISNSTTTNPNTTTPTVPSGSCTNCQIVTVPHKSAPQGCQAPGPCRVNGTLNAKLQALNQDLSNPPPPQRSLALEVTEAYPPTRTHACSCHTTGSCVDANFADRTLKNNSQNIKDFITKATAAGATAVYEVESETRAATIRNQTGLSASQVIFVSGITGEHFSVYNSSCNGN